MRVSRRLWLIIGMVFGLAVLGAPVAADVRVNDPTTDTGDSTTQSETAIAFGNGVLCAGFNDFGPNGLSGWGRSTDFGATWTDLGGINQQGDPVIAHHAATDTFYYASLGSTSPQVNASTDGCASWGAAVAVTTTGTAQTTLADKPWIAVDNTGSGTDGNVYICWTRFYNPGGGGTSELRVARSTDGGATWTNEMVIAAAGTAPFGCSIAVASDASVNVVWADRSANNVLFRRSTDAGVSYPNASLQTVNSGALRTPGTDNIVACGGTNRPTLNGNIRQLAQAWLATDTSGGANDGNLYVVFASDPVNATDSSDVFFSRSTNSGANWSNMSQLGTGGGATDQFEPFVAVAGNGDVAVAWYDRRNDATNNMLIDVYTAFSSDGGANFGGLVRVTDSSFNVPQLLPNFNPGAAQCYMGEYIAVAGGGGGFYYLWGDNRDTVTNANWPAGRPDPNVYFEVVAGPSNTPPSVAVDPASGNEGTSIDLSGSTSDADGDFLVFSWSVTPIAADPGAACSITNGDTLTPSVVCSDDGTYTIELTVTGDASGSVSASDVLTVTNVAPAVVVTSGDVSIDEGGSYALSSTFTDPGWNDAYTATIDWDFPGEGPLAVAPSVTAPGPPEDQGTVGAGGQYGDNGIFTVTVAVVDDDFGTGLDSVVVKVNNVAPTAEIDESGTTVIGGAAVFLASAGDPLDFSGHSTDPGSDDLTLTWDWDDGAPEPDVSTVYLAAPPGADPSPSPTMQPRDVNDAQVHAFTGACVYEIVFASTDDDGGSSDDTATVIIVGNGDEIRSSGYWMHQFRGNGKTDYSEDELLCLLKIVGLVSSVFNEITPASTIEEAIEALWVNGGSDMAALFDAQLLATLLNFASGSVGWDEMVNTNKDKDLDTPFADVVANAEAIRTNPGSTDSEIEEQKNLLDKINRGRATD